MLKNRILWTITALCHDACANSRRYEQAATELVIVQRICSGVALIPSSCLMKLQVNIKK